VLQNNGVYGELPIKGIMWSQVLWGEQQIYPLFICLLWLNTPHNREYLFYLKKERMSIIMENLLPIRDAVDVVLKIMAEREYAFATINDHRSVLNTLLKFMVKNQFTVLNEEIALDFIKEKTGTEMVGFWGSSDRKTNRYMKPVQNLLFYLKDGGLTFLCVHIYNHLYVR
jgi:hypothetical protein